MNKVEGLHHSAICTADMKSQIEYFTDVLGMELVALYWMHGVDGHWHGFLRLERRKFDRVRAERRTSARSRSSWARPTPATPAQTARAASCSTWR